MGTGTWPASASAPGFYGHYGRGGRTGRQGRLHPGYHGVGGHGAVQQEHLDERPGAFGVALVSAGLGPKPLVDLGELTGGPGPGQRRGRRARPA